MHIMCSSHNFLPFLLMKKKRHLFLNKSNRGKWLVLSIRWCMKKVRQREKERKRMIHQDFIFPLKKKKKFKKLALTGHIFVSQAHISVLSSQLQHISVLKRCKKHLFQMKSSVFFCLGSFLEQLPSSSASRDVVQAVCFNSWHEGKQQARFNRDSNCHW